MRTLTKFVFATSCLSATCFAQTAPAAPTRTCTAAPLPNTPADLALTAGDSAKAESLFTSQVAASGNAANFAGLVHAQLAQDKLPEALASANKAVAALPASGDAQALLGEVLTRSGQIPDASQAFAKALAEDPCSANAHVGFARLNDIVGRHLTAVKQYNLAHRLAPGDPAITAVLLEKLKPSARLTPLRTFLATNLALPPSQLALLTSDLAALDQHLTCTPSAPVGSVTLPIERIFQNGSFVRSWGLTPRINDVAMPILELDTTVDGIVLSARDAAKAHVHPLLAAAPAADAPYQGVVDKLNISDMAFTGCVVTVVPNKMVDDRNSLIGTSFFRDHLIHIDYVAKTMQLAPLPAPPAGSGGFVDQFIAPDEKDWSPVYIAGPGVLLPTLINKNGPYLFALDTGIRRSVISPPVATKELGGGKDNTLNLQGYAGAIIKVVPRDGGGDVNLTDIHGPSGALLKVVSPRKLPIYRFTANEFPDEGAVSFDLSPLSHSYGVEVSGLLGFSLLSYYSLDLNYRDGLARVLFDQNRRYHEQSTGAGDY